MHPAGPANGAGGVPAVAAAAAAAAAATPASGLLGQAPGIGPDGTMVHNAGRLYPILVWCAVHVLSS